MITTKRPNTDDYTQVGFIEAKDSNGVYQNIDRIYDNQGNIVFQQGYLNEYVGADDFGIPAIGKPLIDYTIWGNTVQTGTPTPDSPIEPEFVGDLVSIELDEPLRAVGDYKDTLDLETGVLTRRIGKYVVTGSESINNSYGRMIFRDAFLSASESMLSTAYPPSNAGVGRIIGFLNSGVYRAMVTNTGLSTTEFTTLITTLYNSGEPMIIYYALTTPTTETISVPSGLTGVIEGTVTQSGTPTPDNPIEPVFNGKLLPNGKYQVYKTYKIPISSAGQTKTIYLGQVPTTRKIKKLVLTGEENWNEYIYAGYEYMYVPYRDATVPQAYGEEMFISTHYPNRNRISWNDLIRTPSPFLVVLWEIGYYRICYRDDSIFMTVDEVKEYLREQYANGTPVTIWYVIETPTTSIVNEPLAKIGNYADSVDFSQAGIEIPTLKKPNTTVIDVETEVEPSEVDVTYRGATKPQYDLFLAQNGDSFEAQDGQSLYIGGDS